MFIADMLFALVFGFFIVWVVSLTFGTKGPWDNFLWFFLVVALFAWSGGVWLVPFGPLWMGIGWVPIIFMGFLAVLLLTAASPQNSRKAMTAKKQGTIDAVERRAIGIFFWVLIVCLLIFGSTHYFWNPRVF